ncbi:MAG: hypothetical protein WCL39_01905 [Armatimonadota bacterium]
MFSSEESHSLSRMLQGVGTAVWRIGAGDKSGWLPFRPLFPFRTTDIVFKLKKEWTFNGK